MPCAFVAPVRAQAAGLVYDFNMPWSVLGELSGCCGTSLAGYDQIVQTQVLRAGAALARR